MRRNGSGPMHFDAAEFVATTVRCHIEVLMHTGGVAVPGT